MFIKKKENTNISWEDGSEIDELYKIIFELDNGIDSESIYEEAYRLFNNYIGKYVKPMPHDNMDDAFNLATEEEKLALLNEWRNLFKPVATKDSAIKNTIGYLTSYKGSDIWENENTKELYLAITKSGKKLARLNTKDLNKAKQIIEERLSFLGGVK